MYNLIKDLLLKNTVKNSFLSIMSNLTQNLFLSLFFIIIAREYSTLDFSNYIIANTIYSFVLGFSTLGMGHWFIREYLNSDNKEMISYQFFKMQFIAGLIFYFFNVLISFWLYSSLSIRTLSLIMGINLIFDNVIYVIKSLNIAEFDQKRSSILLVIEACLKVMVSLFLFLLPINIFLLSFILISIRFISLNIFIHYGTKSKISLSKIFSAELSTKVFSDIIRKNWFFVVISSISVINWRIGNILVSKFLSLKDVAVYEISYKLLSLSYLIPIMATTSLYPNMINVVSENYNKLKIIYYKSFIPLCIYGLLSFMFIYSYSDILIPFLFGNKYTGSSIYCREMFLVMLIFPTIFLQANVLLTLKLEKLDMICNIICLIVNITLSIILLNYYKSLTAINYSIFYSFIMFHLIQDVILIKNKIISFLHVFKFYSISIFLVLSYLLCCRIFTEKIIFIIYLFIILGLYYLHLINNRYKQKRN